MTNEYIYTVYIPNEPKGYYNLRRVCQVPKKRKSEYLVLTHAFDAANTHSWLSNGHGDTHTWRMCAHDTSTKPFQTLTEAVMFIIENATLTSRHAEVEAWMKLI